MSGPLSVPAAVIAAYAESNTAKIFFALTAFLCVWAAGYGAWKGERQKVIKLQEAADRKKQISEKLGALAENLRAAKRMMNRTITNDAEVEQLKVDFDAWLQKVCAEIRSTISPTAAETFFVLSSVNAASMIPCYNEKHNDLKLYLNAYQKRLNDLLSKHDHQNEMAQ